MGHSQFLQHLQVGAVKAGTNIQIDPAGTISASSYTLFLLLQPPCLVA